MPPLLVRKPDYRAIECLIRGRIHTPDYGPVVEAQEEGGHDTIFRGSIGYEPLQEVIVTIMGLEAFAVEWTQRRDEVLRLYQALVDDRTEDVSRSAWRAGYLTVSRVLQEHGALPLTSAW